MSVDMDRPYKVYGGLQDNSSWVGASQYPGGIAKSQWENMYGGDGFWMFVDPTDPTYIYAEAQGGYIGRINRYTHETRDIKPLPKYKEGKLRFNWNTPIHLSPTRNGTLYLGSQFLHRSRDFGQTWERISPDLTTNDPEKQKQEQSGGVTVDNSSAETHTTIFAIGESPRNPLVMWAGTDDGNLQVTRDAGKSWTNVVSNIKGLPKNAWVTTVEPGHFDAGTIYATFDMHTFGDMRPYAYKSTDYGKTWTSLISSDSPVRGYAHVIKEDLVNPRLLFLGTELGLW
ncbi:MAG: WD40/YVTN/BNR-like repeat-containing protein, partial [Gemmatimonadaceae bacterium]